MNLVIRFDLNECDKKIFIPCIKGKPSGLCFKHSGKWTSEILQLIHLGLKPIEDEQQLQR